MQIKFKIKIVSLLVPLFIFVGVDVKAWDTYTIDNSGGESWSSSIDVDDLGFLDICFLVDSPNSTTHLKYATNESGQWLINTVGQFDGFGYDSSMVTDSQERIHVVYVIDEVGSGRQLFYATNETGTWIYQILDNQEIGSNISIAVDSNDNLHIVYSSNYTLKYASKKLGVWNYYTIDDLSPYSSSVAADSLGKAHISYVVSSGLKYATNTSGTWQTIYVETSSDVAGETDIAIDLYDKAHVSYYDRNSKDLKYATNVSGNWQKETVDSNGDVGDFSSIAVDALNFVHIGYMDRVYLGSMEFSNFIKYATRSSEGWTTQTVDSIGDWQTYVDIITDENCKIHICYFGEGGSLRFASEDPLDSDSDGVPDRVETAHSCLNVNDADTDDDGLNDGQEDANRNGTIDPGETDPCNPDTDGDGIQDGTESGLTLDDIGPDTDQSVFVPDADPTATTNPLLADTDRDGISDGDEDLDRNGRVDLDESDPNTPDAVSESKAMPWIPLLLLTEDSPEPELLVYDWNELVTVADRGFPWNQPPMASANGDWTVPTNFAEGTFYFRCEVFSQPVPQQMRLQFCVWQDNLTLETCSPMKDVSGTPGTVETWSVEIDNMWKKNSVPIDWSRPRQRYGVAIKNTAGDPVSNFLDWNWNGEEPDEWYPLGMRFTVVVVEEGETFSGWDNYIP
jgi:hypothetical protein